MTTTAITAQHTVQFWVDTAYRASTIEQGLDNLRHAWRSANSLTKDERLTAESRDRARITKDRIEAAAVQVQHEQGEAEEHAEQARRDREDSERAAAAKVRLEDAMNTRQESGESYDAMRARRAAAVRREVSPWSAVREASAKLPALPHAHYAVEENGELHFFRIDKPQEGRWVGRTFVKIQASEEYYPIKAPERLVAILSAIAENPQAAMERYGREIGRCGHCHRTLTNPESIARGIGPICAGRMGW